MNTLEVFKALVISPEQVSTRPNFELLDLGLVLDFYPTEDQKILLNKSFKPLNVNTLFSVEERLEGDPITLITKQIIHYFNTYGMGVTDTFVLNLSADVKITINRIRGITLDELGDMIRTRLYSNAPIKSIDIYEEMIKTLKLEYDFNSIKNNEARIRLYDGGSFTSGDDAVRYIVYRTTDSTDLIKTGGVIEQVQNNRTKIDEKFLEENAFVLSTVFNRHKKIIMATKNNNNKTIINKISRMSKTNHVPIKEALGKRFVYEFSKGRVTTASSLSVRDMFKILNFVSVKKASLLYDMITVRNGKTWIKSNDKKYTEADLAAVESCIINELTIRLKDLKDKNILLDTSVDYGLPASEKQTVGRLPFWTKVACGSGKLSAGIHWRNEWGATDLDLSAIDMSGDRIGWGSSSGYTRNGIIYSGDVTSARDGAMEFFTSKKTKYLLINNIYAGKVGCEFEFVVGDASKTKWIEEVHIREKSVMTSREMIVGFVDGDSVVIYMGRRGNRSVSAADNPAITQVNAERWTVTELLKRCGIKYDVKAKKNTVYDHDLRYTNFTFEKLENLFN